MSKKKETASKIKIDNDTSVTYSVHSDVTKPLTIDAKKFDGVEKFKKTLIKGYPDKPSVFIEGTPIYGKYSECSVGVSSIDSHVDVTVDPYKIFPDKESESLTIKTGDFNPIKFIDNLYLIKDQEFKKVNKLNDIMYKFGKIPDAEFNTKIYKFRDNNDKNIYIYENKVDKIFYRLKDIKFVIDLIEHDKESLTEAINKIILYYTQTYKIDHSIGHDIKYLTIDDIKTRFSNILFLLDNKLPEGKMLIIYFGETVYSHILLNLFHIIINKSELSNYVAENKKINKDCKFIKLK